MKAFTANLILVGKIIQTQDFEAASLTDAIKDSADKEIDGCWIEIKERRDA